MTRVALVVQARMTSTRLPGKVLMPIGGRPMLALMLERLERARTPSIRVVATTANTADDPIDTLARAHGWSVVRGPEEDVLERYRMAADAFNADVVVRVTSDCPLIDPEILDGVVSRVLGGGCDYASNTLRRTYPRGLDVEAVTRSAIDAAATEAGDPAEREHVTPYIYGHPERFRLCGVEATVDLSEHRWTVDTNADLELIRRLYGALWDRHPDFTTAELLDVLDQHPDWRALNANVQQKPMRLEGAS